VCVTVRGLCKSRPNESTSSRRELQNLTSDLGCVARPGDLGLVLSDLVSLRRGTTRLSEAARKLERFWARYLAQARSIGVLSDSVSLRRETFAWARSRCEMTWLSGSSFRRGEGVALSDGATRPGEGISPKWDNV